MHDAAHVYSFDIETDTSVQADGRQYGLEPLNAGITEISLAWDPSVLPGGGAVFATGYGLNEADIIMEFDKMLYGLPPGLLVGWNSSFFDLPFILTRAEALGIGHRLHLHAQPGLVPKYDPTPPHTCGYSAVWGTSTPIPHQHLDIQWHYEAAAKLLGIKWGLKPVAVAYGLDMVEVDRENMHLLTADKRRAYALSDAVGTRNLGLHMLGLPVPEISDPILALAASPSR